jgi:hypothetical protein
MNHDLLAITWKRVPCGHSEAHPALRLDPLSAEPDFSSTAGTPAVRDDVRRRRWHRRACRQAVPSRLLGHVAWCRPGSPWPRWDRRHRRTTVLTGRLCRRRTTNTGIGRLGSSLLVADGEAAERSERWTGVKGPLEPVAKARRLAAGGDCGRRSLFFVLLHPAELECSKAHQPVCTFL